MAISSDLVAAPSELGRGGPGSQPYCLPYPRYGEGKQDTQGRAG